MFNVADLAKYSPFYEVRWFNVEEQIEGTETYDLDDLKSAENLYKFRLEQDTWDFVELKMVLDFDFKIITE